MEILEKLKQYARNNNVPIMMDDGLKFLVEYIKKNNVKNILEIGSAIGYSAIVMASISDDIFIETLELDVKRYEIAKQNINDFNLSNRVKIFNVDAMEYVPQNKFDLIFVDAAKSQYSRYMEHYLPYCNGVFVFDNINFHGIVENMELTKNRNTKNLVKKIKRFRDEILIDNRFKTDFYKDIGDGVIVAKVK